MTILNRRSFLVRSSLALSAGVISGARLWAAPKAPVQIGAYYFDGWAGQHALANNPNEPWAKNAPTHLTRRMLEEFPEREPIWGWRDDTQAVVEQQIDLAADAGLSFFSFCWYWHPDQKKVDEDCKHTGLNLYLKAKNRERLKFCLLIANHAGFLLNGADDWRKAADYWMPYLTHKQHVTVGGKPLLIIFNPGNANQEGFAALQAAARTAGLPGLAIAACGTGARAMGFTHRSHYNIVPGYASGSKERLYRELVEAHQKQWSGSAEQPYIPEITAGWDKRPWEGRQGLNQPAGSYFPDRTPESFTKFLESGVEWMDQHANQTTAERLVLIYAWNEFGEGGYIAPTKGDPDGKYLKALKSVVSAANK